MVHITDAASATVAAIERGRPGIYNVADDEPAPVRDILRELARVLGAKPPRRVPAWLARLVAGKGPVDIMTQARGIASEEGQTGTGLDPSVSELAHRFHRGTGITSICRPRICTASCGRGRLPSPTRCSAVSAKARTWYKRRSCGYQ